MKKKLLSTAIAAGMGMGLMSTAAQAVYVNSQGTGQVLLYPYYSAENGNDTYVQVVNTSDVGKVVKVRFLESKNSDEVLDFNLYLSAQDVWAGAVTATADGGAKIVTSDNSCTTPGISSEGEAFRTFEFTGDDDQSVARTAQGHLEIIGMADIQPGSDLEGLIEHVDGTPPGCADIPADLTGSTDLLPFGSTGNGAGLYGFSQLVNVEDGVAAKMDATALADFSTNVLWTQSGSTAPSLEDVNTDAIVFDGANARTLDAIDGDNVSAVLMTRDIQNSYVVDEGINAGTDWIVTFPTKFLYSEGDPAGDPLAPFTSVWDGDKACESVSLSVYDREERMMGGGTTVDFSPTPPDETGPQLCYEANVITFNNSNVIGASNAKNISSDFASGWMNLGFDQGQSMDVDEAGTTITMNGLPAIGYSVVKYTNGTIGGVVRNYMGASKHKETPPVGN